jgi:hypothetical protein
MSVARDVCETGSRPTGYMGKVEQAASTHGIATTTASSRRDSSIGSNGNTGKGNSSLGAAGPKWLQEASSAESAVTTAAKEDVTCSSSSVKALEGGGSQRRSSTISQKAALSSTLRSPSSMGSKQRGSSAVVAAAAAAAAIRNVREVQQLNLELVRTAAPKLLPDVIRDTEAEAVRAAATGWTRVFPASSNTLLAKQLALFETPRLNNALVARYQQQLCTKNT